jgi:hypothetical protein
MKKTSLYIFSFLFVILISSCTNLEEIILDETSAGNLTPRQAADGLIAPVYALLPTIFQHTTYFALQEITTDEAILPYRGGTDWGDNGIYLALHRQTYDPNNANVRNTWNPLLQSVSRTVTALQALPLNTDPVAKEYLAEAKGMRAYFSLLTLDLYGLVFVKDNPDAGSQILRGDAAVKFIEKELLDVEPLLGTTAGPGRLTKGAVWGLLARLYLNAPVYRDIYASSFNFTASDMDNVIKYCDKIISSGQYALASEYFSIFDDNNNTNKELIFAIDQRGDLNGHNRLAYFSLSGDMFPLAAFPNANGTDGPAITSDFYQTWAKAYAPEDPSVDPRFHKQNVGRYTNPADTCVNGATYEINRGIQRGQQYGLQRNVSGFTKCANGNFLVGPLVHLTRNKFNLPVNHTERVDFTPQGSDYPSGYRVEKYQFSRISDSGRNKGQADIVILRLADIYLMRAEAKLRKSNDAAGALADVNFVRASRTARKAPPALSSMNLDLLFRERGFEFYWEMLRRTDMIRFGKYEGIWTEKTNTDKNKRIFPIPQTAIDGASNLKDYLKQNAGY